MKEILSTLKKVRVACEEIAINKYFTDTDWYSNKDLSCMCAIASKVIFKLLKKKFKKVCFVAGKWKTDADDFHHCWVEVNDKIIDITATQFGPFPKIIITGQGTYHYSEEREKFWSEKEIKDFLAGWPSSQSPDKEVVSEIMKRIS